MATAWVPPRGRHSVSIGSSLSKALKAHVNGELAPQPLGKKPEKNFYSLRYKFKPNSVATSEPGRLDVKGKSKDGASSVQVEYPSTQANETHSFSGTEVPAKGVTCVLIFDEETGRFTLEKIDSQIYLDRHERKAGQPIAISSSAKPPPAVKDEFDDDLEREFNDILPDELSSSRHVKKQEEEEVSLNQVVSKSSAKQKPKPRPSAATKSTISSKPALLPSKAQQSLPPQAPTQASKGKQPAHASKSVPRKLVAVPAPAEASPAKRPYSAMDSPVAQPPKKQPRFSGNKPQLPLKPAPAPVPTKLALPGASTNFMPLPGSGPVTQPSLPHSSSIGKPKQASQQKQQAPAPVASSSRSKAAPVPAPAMAPPPQAPKEEEESDGEEWEEFGATKAIPSTSTSTPNLQPSSSNATFAPPPSSVEDLQQVFQEQGEEGVPSFSDHKFMDTFEEDDGSDLIGKPAGGYEPEEGEDDEDDFEAVPVPVASADTPGSGGPGIGEEIDMDEFEEIMNANLEVAAGSSVMDVDHDHDHTPSLHFQPQEQEEEDDDDFLAVAVSPQPEFKSAPVPLSQWAGGSLDQDEYSSTDDSDDE